MKRTLAHLWIGINAAISMTMTIFFVHPAHSSEQIELNIGDTQIEFSVFSNGANNSKDNVILWLPSEHGLPDSVLDIAQSLSQENSIAQVWVANLFSSLFLPVQASSIDKISNDVLYQLLKKLHAKTQKRLFIVASGKGALLAMRASHFWLQDDLTTRQFGGIILLHPNLFTKTPEPGTAAQYYPVTHGVNVAIFILQPENSPWRWQLATLQQHLINAKARPYISILPKVRDRFFFRPDATEQEQQTTQNLATILHTSIQYLASEPIRRYPLPTKLPVSASKQPKKQLTKLRRYTKNPTPPALNLKDLAGNASSLQQYRGKVVVVNFWASWCPPCVHEMPSMETLYQRYPRSEFTILAVNMAEDHKTITEFIQNRVHVSFPILLDSDGKALHDWQVFAFPSSFVIDKKGKIRYALFGSILWDTPQVYEIIDKLINLNSG